MITQNVGETVRMKEILVISLSFSTVLQPYVANDKAVCSGTLFVVDLYLQWDLNLH